MGKLITCGQVHEKGANVTKMRAFFKSTHTASGRLNQMGRYFRVDKKEVDQRPLGVIQEHAKHLQKLEHNVRLEQVQQHLTLMKILHAQKSEKGALAQKQFEENFEKMINIAAMASVERADNDDGKRVKMWRYEVFKEDER